MNMSKSTGESCGIVMEKWIGLHMDYPLLIMGRGIRGRKMAEWLGNVKRGYTGKKIGRDTKTWDGTMAKDGRDRET